MTNKIAHKKPKAFSTFPHPLFHLQIGNMKKSPEFAGMSDSYTIVLPQFEGPFDLLLFFIERDELDIHDIPIARITNEFLDYIRQMEAMNIDLASEFVLVAATLCRIKAKMLIPRKQVDEEGNEIDPREELVQRLMEYKRIKSILEEMRTLEENRAKQFARGNISRELKGIANKALADEELENLSLYKLLVTFQKLLDRLNAKPPTIHRIYQFNYTIEDQQNHIYKQVRNHKKASFEDIFGNCENRIHAIITFLALLELLNLQTIKILVREGFNNFWLKPGISPQEEANT